MQFVCHMIFCYRYEGTGRSLSLKLIQQLREQGNKLQTNGNSDGGPVSGTSKTRLFIMLCSWVPSMRVLMIITECRCCAVVLVNTFLVVNGK